MNSNDINSKVEKMMAADGFIWSHAFTLKIYKNKSEVMASLNKALLEYSYQKLIENDEIESVVMDLGVLFDKLDEHLQPYEKGNFYANYIICMLEIQNSLAETNIAWYETPEDGNVYPRFNQVGEFETTRNSSMKENALWLNKALMETYCKSAKTATKKL